MTSRAWLIATVVATLVVMGGMVAWGLRERANPTAAAGQSRRPPPTRVPRVGPVEPDREFEMPPGCEVDPKRPPKLVFDLVNDQIDFGAMRQGQVATREVVVRNVGSGPLCISDVHAGCGCIRVKLVGGKQRIEPTESATIEVTVDVGPSRQDLQQKDVNVHTNEPGRKRATFRVTADVRLGLMLLDPVAQFGRAMRGRPATATVRLRSPADDPEWTVTAVEGAQAPYTFEIDPPDATKEPGFRHVALKVRHPGTDELGPRVDTLKIKTNHPERPEVLVHTNMNVVDRYFASPPQVPFGVLETEKTGSWLPLRILAADPKGSVPFAGARIEGAGFEVGETAPIGTGEWSVAVRPSARGVAPGRVNAALVVALDDPEMKELRVPLKMDVVSREVRSRVLPPEPVSRTR